mgnify:FL=1
MALKQKLKALLITNKIVTTSRGSWLIITECEHRAGVQPLNQVWIDFIARKPNHLGVSIKKNLDSCKANDLDKIKDDQTYLFLGKNSKGYGDLG